MFGTTWNDAFARSAAHLVLRVEQAREEAVDEPLGHRLPGCCRAMIHTRALRCRRARSRSCPSALAPVTLTDASRWQRAIRIGVALHRVRREVREPDRVALGRVADRERAPVESVGTRAQRSRSLDAHAR
jgi:hypothetical protein